MIGSTATFDKGQKNLAYQSYIKPQCQHRDAATNFPSPQIVNISQEIVEDHSLITQLSADESNLDNSSDRQQCPNKSAELVSKQAHDRQDVSLSSSQQNYSGLQARPFTLVANQSSQEWSETYQWFRRQYQEHIMSLQLSRNSSQEIITQLYAQLSQENEEIDLVLESNFKLLIFMPQDLHRPEDSENSCFQADDIYQSHKQQEYQLIPPPTKEASIIDKRFLQILSINFRKPAVLAIIFLIIVLGPNLS